jgi:hypothetical protein
MEIGELVGTVLRAILPDKKKEPDPTVTARWDRKSVTAVHNVNWPPATPPTDSPVSPDSIARLMVHTTNVPDGSKVTITVHDCATGAMVKDGKIENLQIMAGIARDKNGNLPLFYLEAKHKPWDVWDKPFFFFKVQVAYAGLKTETPSDYMGQTEQTLRVDYHHAIVYDWTADNPGPGIPGLTTGQEAASVQNILKMPWHQPRLTAFNTQRVPAGVWGSVVRNSYSYHLASHGTVIDPATKGSAPMDKTGSAPLAKPGAGPWRSIFVLGRSGFGEAKISSGDVPSVPRYLVYLNCCLAGWEPSLANAFLAKGTQNVIAFRVTIPDDEARNTAIEFFNKWRSYDCDPGRIPQLFWQIHSQHFGGMRPILFGMGGGPVEQAALLNKLSAALWETIASAGP